MDDTPVPLPHHISKRVLQIADDLETQFWGEFTEATQDFPDINDSKSISLAIIPVVIQSMLCEVIGYYHPDMRKKTITSILMGIENNVFKYIDHLKDNNI